MLVVSGQGSRLAIHLAKKSHPHHHGLLVTRFRNSRLTSSSSSSSSFSLVTNSQIKAASRSISYSKPFVHNCRAFHSNLPHHLTYYSAALNSPLLQDQVPGTSQGLKQGVAKSDLPEPLESSTHGPGGGGLPPTCTSPAADLMSWPTEKLTGYLKENKIARCWTIKGSILGSSFPQDGTPQAKVAASHNHIRTLAEWLISDPVYEPESLESLASKPDVHPYDNHEAVFLAVGRRTGLLMGVFVWNTTRGQAIGGIRVDHFPTVQSFVHTGLRHSMRIGKKSALAGLWYGGGKGLIAAPKDKTLLYKSDFRQNMFFDFGDFVTSLNGVFGAAIDTGVSADDLYNVHSKSRWTYCMPPDVGGANSSSRHLALGTLNATEAALKHLGMGSFKGKIVALQGAGNVGFELIGMLLAMGVSRLYVTETSKKRIEDILEIFSGFGRDRLKIERVPIRDTSIMGANCDILIPVAHGGILNMDTVNQIQAKIVCGTAKEMIDPHNLTEVAETMRENGICYVPELIPNRMQLVMASMEPFGRRADPDPLIERHYSRKWEHSIYCATEEILKVSDAEGVTTLEAFDRVCEKYIHQPHPIYPDRWHQVIKNLWEQRWHEGHDYWLERTNATLSEVSHN